ncbi:unnamed protein product [Absidia cylindrospora]
MDDNANSTSEEHYAGWKEQGWHFLHPSIPSQTSLWHPVPFHHPNCHPYSRNIALWAETDKLKTSAKALHQTWVSRYHRQAKDLKPLMKPKSLAFDKQTCTFIAKLMDANKITDLQFTTESVKVLGSYSKQATDKVLWLLLYVTWIRSRNNIASTLILVDDLKRSCLERGDRTKQGYRVLKILEILLEPLGSHTRSESEATTTRRISHIMEELFRWTKVKIVDGEHSSDCTNIIFE